ncbi:MAG TPA: C cytochrome precursor, partial [Verrucomicrobia bacterium]|nr:C cytochrome precursor [Verrucomicrobiota bacterium]
QRVGLLTGSHRFQNFWIHAGYGNTQYILPFSWIIKDNRWVPISEVFLKPPDEPSVIQVWNNQCIVCHASAPQPRKQQDSMVFDSRTAEIGISCESCHGPAEEHVARYRNPLTRYRNHFTDDSETGIRNPEKMDHRLSSQVCGQCHSARINFEPQLMTQGTTYRPGKGLHESFGILLPGRPDSLPGLRRNIEEDPEFYQGTFWPDGIIRVTGREFNSLLVTPCFERGEMSCLSCHSSHDSDPNDQLAEGMRTNQACIQCHDSFSDKLTQHTRHSAGSSGSLCYNCHMPHTTYGLLGAIRNHYIDSPNVKKTLETGRPNACNSCHLDKTLAWTNNQLKEWYGTAPADLNESQKSTAASILNLLSGDANQRVLTAWAMGWKPAREVSGEDWIPHYLVEAMKDNYSTIRYIAHKSLINIPGYENTDFDFVAAESVRTAIIGRIPLSPTLLDSQRVPDQQRVLLFDSVGRLMRDEVRIHINRRDTKPISLME